MILLQDFYHKHCDVIYTQEWHMKVWIILSTFEGKKNLFSQHQITTMC
jgi:stress-induced morphogen